MNVAEAFGKVFLSPGKTPDILEATSTVGTILGVILIIIFVSWIIYDTYKNSSKEPLPATSSVNAAIGTRVNALKDEKELIGTKSFYDGLLPTIPENQRYLINFSPLTASLGGYIGGNVFYSSEYIQRALKAGIHSFTLPISVYMDDNKMPPNWPLSGKPAIVRRSEDGKITSLNALTIGQFCRELMSFKAINPSQANEPYILYIEEDTRYTPDHVKGEKEYVKLMSDIAKELTSIGNSLLQNLGAYGSATGGVNADKILLETPMVELKNKVLIITNFDTRLQLKDAYKGITPRLHDYVHFIYKPTVVESIELGDVQGGTVKYSDKTRTAWYVARTDVPVLEGVKKGLSEGIQAIPLPFFAVDNKVLEGIHKEWNGYTMKPKPEGIRFTKQPPIVPKMPSERLNARVPGANQPGEIIIR